MNRIEFEMTDEQRTRLLDAVRPLPYIVIGGHPPESQQERANRAWQSLADQLGFVWDTVRPIPGKSDRFFTAIKKE